jgi:hypothetical protein
MTLKEILTELEVIEGQLDDAFYQLPEYNANEDTRSYLDGSRNDLYTLKDSLERAILDGAEVTVSYEVNN